MKCNTCLMTFQDRESLTTHYHTDFHRFNILLKAKQESPLTMEEYNKFLEEKERKEREEEELKNKKKNSKKNINHDDGEENFIPEKCYEIPTTECLFCTKKFDTTEQTIEHMKTHGFRFPYEEKLASRDELLEYLGVKVGIGHCCIECHRQFRSLRAVRSHMKSCCHTVYEFDEEVEDFYKPDDSALVTEEPYLNEIGELHLPDGTIIGCRKWLRYYKQKPQDIESLRKSCRKMIGGPGQPRETITEQNDRVFRIRESYRLKYISKREQRVASKDYHPASDMRRGNAV